MDLSDWKRFKRSGGFKRKVAKRCKVSVKPGSSGIKTSVSSTNTVEVNEDSVVTNNSLPLAHDSESEEFENFLEDYDFDFEETTDYELNRELVEGIKSWAIKFNIPHRALNELSAIVNKRLSNVLPKDARTLLHTNKETVVIQTSEPGHYWHNGLIKCLKNILQRLDLNSSIKTISLNINIDGLPVYNSSRHQLWPILCNIFEISHIPPFVIGIYAGDGKPSDLNAYLGPFVTEMKEIETDGLVTTLAGTETTIKVKIRAFICDSPARALIKGGVYSLRNMSIKVPRAAMSGPDSSVTLRCDFDLENEGLYSTRWYHSNAEFYRFVPKVLPPAIVFPLPGATVDLSSSTDNEVRIVSLHRRLSGEYKCEVTSDTSFHTDIKAANLTVVDPPFRKPSLSLSRASFMRNDVIVANCSIDEAYPQPNITWIIDGEKVAEWISPISPSQDYKERPAYSQLHITVKDTGTHSNTYTSTLNRLYSDIYVFHGDKSRSEDALKYSLPPPRHGQFTVCCVATIFDIYARQSDPITIKEDTPHPASVTGEDSAGSLRSADFTKTVLIILVLLMNAL